MNIYFHYLKIGYPREIKQPIYQQSHHVMYGVLKNKCRSSCMVCNDIASFNDIDKNIARKAFTMLYMYCTTGLPLKDLYAHEKGAYHEAFSVKIGNLEKKVIRIRKSDIRIYFVFIEKKLVIFCVKIKKENKLSKGEIEHMSSIVRNIFEYENDSDFNKRLIK